MCVKLFFIICSLLSMVNSTVFDQRQSGDLNVQVDLKGLQIIALMKGGKEEYVDYDYAYDYSEMTIKPQNRTTPKPFNVTIANDKPDAVEINTTMLIPETTTIFTQTLEATGALEHAANTNHDNNTIKTTDNFNVTEVPEFTPNTTTDKTTLTALNSTQSPTVCRKGFVQNSKGDCEIKLQGTGNALLKLVKLSQKLKLRRENKSDNIDK